MNRKVLLSLIAADVIEKYNKDFIIDKTKIEKLKIAIRDYRYKYLKRGI